MEIVLNVVCATQYCWILSHWADRFGPGQRKTVLWIFRWTLQRTAYYFQPMWSSVLVYESQPHKSSFFLSTMSHLLLLPLKSWPSWSHKKMEHYSPPLLSFISEIQPFIALLMKKKNNIFKHLLEPIFGNWRLFKSQIIAPKIYMIDSSKTNDFSGYFKIHYFITWDHNWK